MEGLLKKLLTVVGLVSLVCLYAEPAAANPVSVDMTMTSVGSGNILGPAYIGPYIASIDSGTSTADFKVICDDFLADSYLYESWTATVSTLADLSQTKFKDLTGYEVVAWLSSQLLNPSTGCAATPSCLGAIQYAIWQVFDNTSPTPFSYLLPADQIAAQSWLDQAKAAVASNTFNMGEYAGLVIFTPTACLSGQCMAGAGLPQEFVTIRAVPEPASLLLFALGTATLAGYRRRAVARRATI
jgi:hypothetical protein